MISQMEDTAFKFIETIFRKGKMTLLESKNKATGERTLLLCALKPTEDGGADLVPVGIMFQAQESSNIGEKFELPEGAEERPTTTGDFKEYLS